MTEAATRRPLLGRRIVLTRAREKADALAERLVALGAEPLLYPAIAFAPPDSYEPLDAAIGKLETYDWIIFTSANGVAAFVDRLTELDPGWQLPAGVKIGAVGPATTQALSEAGITTSFMPDKHVAEAMVEQIGGVAGKSILLPSADIARATLADGLRAKGAAVNVVTAYRTVPSGNMAELATRLRAGEIDALTFTSSSTVLNLLKGLEHEGFQASDFERLPYRPAIVCIGPITAQTALDSGLRVDATAEDYTGDGLIAALARLFDAPKDERID